MGSNSAPYLANLYLYAQEISYFNKEMRCYRNYNPSLINFFRLQDDISVTNDGGNFERKFDKIYDHELSLKRINDKPE